jgi:NADH:ubiquinone oxidoreductase subunit 2 (subunit N)
VVGTRPWSAPSPSTASASSSRCLIAVSIALAALLADGYLRREGLEGPELYALMLLSGAAA